VLVVTLPVALTGFWSARSGCKKLQVNKNETVNARIRLAIPRWPEAAPCGAVTAFCTDHAIVLQMFHAIPARARDKGQASTLALAACSRRPKTSPTKPSEDLKNETLRVRATVESSGLDHGPLRVHDKMVSLKLQSLSVASLARIFTEKYVVRLEPTKTPGPVPQVHLPGAERVLANGRHRIPAHRWAEVRDRPAAGLPFPSRGRLTRGLRRHQRSGLGSGADGHRSPRGATKTLDGNGPALNTSPARSKTGLSPT
jgi:hypothetical protein